MYAFLECPPGREREGERELGIGGGVDGRG